MYADDGVASDRYYIKGEYMHVRHGPIGTYKGFNASAYEITLRGNNQSMGLLLQLRGLCVQHISMYL